MPAVFAPIDQDLLTRFHNGDEHAFERLVREEFPALSAQANRELNEPAAAGRVAENALLAAWEARDQIDTPTALEYFLKDAVHKGAVRERSRRAMLHRMQEHEGAATPHVNSATEETVDEAWAHVAAALHPTLRSAEQSNQLRGEIHRHGAASHVASVATRGPHLTVQTALLGALVVVLVVGIIAGALFWGTRGTEEQRVDSALASSEARVVTTRGGQRARTALGDGSNVEIGAGTTLRIAPNFAERTRAVDVDGTASFNVAADSRGRFFVRAGNTLIRATGTIFDVSAFPSDSLTVVRVREGEVEVGPSDSATTVAAGRTVVITADGRAGDAPPGLADEALGWVDGNFVVVDRQLREVLPLLQRWYGLQLKVTDPALLERRATVRAPLSSSREAIDQIKATAKVGYGSRQGEAVLFDAAEERRPAARRR